jgi:hypothetical protein
MECFHLSISVGRSSCCADVVKARDISFRVDLGFQIVKSLRRCILELQYCFNIKYSFEKDCERSNERTTDETAQIKEW